MVKKITPVEGIDVNEIRRKMANELCDVLFDRYEKINIAHGLPEGKSIHRDSVEVGFGGQVRVIFWRNNQKLDSTLMQRRNKFFGQDAHTTNLLTESA